VRMSVAASTVLITVRQLQTRSPHGVACASLPTIYQPTRPAINMSTSRAPRRRNPMKEQMNRILVCLLLIQTCHAFLRSVVPTTTIRFGGEARLPTSRQSQDGVDTARRKGTTILYQASSILSSLESNVTAAGAFSSLWSTESSTAATEDTTQTTSGRPPPANHQSVAVVGSGAVGCFYGIRLWEAGHSVHFYMRGEHLDASRARGLSLTSIDGDVTIPPDELQAHESTAGMAQNGDAPANGFDWVIVALKSSSLEAIPPLLEPLLAPSKTRVLVIMNGLIEDDLIRLIKAQMNEADAEGTSSPLRCCQTLYGGMAFLCSNRVAPGRIDHSYAGQLSVGVASTQSSSAEEDRRAVEELWQGVKVPLVWEPCLLAGRWRKNVWNLAFNGLSTAMGGWTVDRIVQDPSLRALSSTIMDETIRAGNADLRKKYGDGNYEPLNAEFKKLMFNLTDKMGPYKTSTMLDLTNRRPMEVKYLFQVPVQRARELGVPASHLETVVAQIEALQRLYGL
jgi:2-dehydropantoate 2-reductase